MLLVYSCTDSFTALKPKVVLTHYAYSYQATRSPIPSVSEGRKAPFYVHPLFAGTRLAFHYLPQTDFLAKFPLHSFISAFVKCQLCFLLTALQTMNMLLYLCLLVMFSFLYWPYWLAANKKQISIHGDYVNSYFLLKYSQFFHFGFEVVKLIWWLITFNV